MWNDKYDVKSLTWQKSARDSKVYRDCHAIFSRGPKLSMQNKTSKKLTHGKAKISNRNKKSIRGKTIEFTHGKTNLTHARLAAFSFAQAKQRK